MSKNQQTMLILQFLLYSFY